MCADFGDDMLEELLTEWDKNLDKTTTFYRRQSFSEKFGVYSLPQSSPRLCSLQNLKKHIKFDEVFLASAALDPLLIEKGGNMISENLMSCLYKGEINSALVFIQVLKQYRGAERYFIYQVNQQEKQYLSPWTMRMLNYSCDTKHLVLIYENCNYRSLHAVLHNNWVLPKLSWTARVQIIYNLSVIISKIHKQDKSHGRIRSDNVFLNKNISCKLGDFGEYPLKKDFDEDVKSLGCLMLELFVRHDQFHQDSKRILKLFQSSDLEQFLSNKDPLLCDVENCFLRQYLEMAHTCLNHSGSIDSVVSRVSTFYEKQCTLITAQV